MQISLKGFRKFVSFVDKFCGTVEPFHRKVVFFYDKGLKAYGTDGCAKFWILLKKDFPPFNNAYEFSIQHLKGLIKGSKKDTDINFKITENSFSIFLENLEINTKLKTVYPNVDTKNPQKVSILTPSLFLRNIDFASVSAFEGENINIYTDKDELIASYDGGLFLTEAFIGYSEINLNREIPYVTVRHLIKSLRELNLQRLELHSENGELIFSFPGGIISICNVISDFTKSTGEEKIILVKELNIKPLRTILDKMITTFPRYVKSVMSFGKNGLKIYAHEEGVNFSWKIDITFDTNVKIYFYPKKLRSIISRFPEKILMVFTNKNIIFMTKDKSKKLYLKIIKDKIEYNQIQQKQIFNGE